MIGLSSEQYIIIFPQQGQNKIIIAEPGYIPNSLELKPQNQKS